MPYYEKIAKAGITEAHYSYHDRSRPEPGIQKVKRKRRERPTPERQRKNNMRRAAQRLTLEMNENFGPNDWYITYNYRPDERPKNRKEIAGQMAKMLRKLRSIYKKAKKVFKYIWVPEVGARGGTHIHMVLTGIDVRLIRSAWEHGSMYIEPMWEDRNYRRLAEYFVEYSEKTRKTLGGKQIGRYNPSQNLTHPKIEKRLRKRRTFDPGRIVVPDGWYVDKDSVEMWVNDEGYKYMYYILVKLTNTERGPDGCKI